MVNSTSTPTSTSTGREWQLAARPHGWPTPADFALVETPVPEPGPGQILVRNLFLSVDPYMRGRMNDVKSYMPPFGLDRPMDGGAVGRVVASQADGVPVGTHVLHGLGWREYALVDAAKAAVVDPAAAPLSAYLGVLGMTGMTAYVGLLRIAEMAPGETVFVSGAAGAVGSQVGQIAKLKGAARVIGSAGSDEKCAQLVEEYGFDAAFNYKKEPVAQQLAAAAPDGIDVYFDNVGGDHLEAAISALRLNGRAALCGSIAAYNSTEPPPGPRNLGLLVGRRLTLRGFMVGDHHDLQDDFVREVGGWLRDGQLRYRETVTTGIDQAVAAFLGMLRGENSGKAVVALPE
ncbi:NADP-dependent oxidoreductase [Streptomyces cocklensis]|jgi:NADPH-dependent curcumin reductase CurA|uniref:NADP-dependent oxidoreductase YfmJ n=1 Tax=Actinacidiphila cocklensis TaxID=887465 RepID=A0A9W4DMR3_9ACTN|nr:NADP-dependent oxidoreductase [Actinacidiphila cocklensis]MDD1057968.1 NADP-dependent oxidoreductase [Actinacidiphila cocklensis]WSX74346.1 NADP-dependent oxidoreductase [Streptomyces sp. NBC_00899]WSX79589.1 NADP-dependent oxidoreductase [Streptomyces sp. NBC_00899]CAG6392977.1 Putative NADP-dependent oxidoreductase YfmJ [Actinacidiphila cocklensis]